MQIPFPSFAGGLNPVAHPNFVYNFFYDREEVVRKLGVKKSMALARAGGWSRKVIRNSLRRRKRVSKPGETPSIHAPPSEKFRTLKNIKFWHDMQSDTGIVGPIGFKVTQSGVVPAILERGADIKRKNPRRRRRKVGGSGEVRVSPRSSTTMTITRAKPEKEVVDWQGKKQYVVYAKLKTQSQADLANRLNEQLYGPEDIAGHVDPRPFMRPGMEQAAIAFPELYVKEGT